MNVNLRAKYLDALGMPEHLQKPWGKVATVNKTMVKCLVVENQQNALFSKPGQIQDFLLKMLGAIGLESSDVALVNADDLDKTLMHYQADTILLTGDAITCERDNCFSMDHPSVILKEPALKRPAWEILKQLQQCLKTTH